MTKKQEQAAEAASKDRTQDPVRLLRAERARRGTAVHRVRQR